MIRQYDHSGSSHRKDRWTPTSTIFTVVGTLAGIASLVVAVVALRDPPKTDAVGKPSPSPTGVCPAPAGGGGRVVTKTPWLSLQFYCEDTRLPVVDKTDEYGRGPVEITVGSAPFEIRVPKLSSGGMAICAWSDESIFDKANVGTDPNKDYSSPFTAGKGMAATTGNETLYLNDDAFNYFVDDRVTHLSAQQDSINVSGFTSDQPLDPHDDIYLLIYIDRDENGIIDNGEIASVILRR
jgi:hypothetical protein